jgi:hypothetical protein
LAVDVPNFFLVEVVLPGQRPKTKKEAFWVEFYAAIESPLLYLVGRHT